MSQARSGGNALNVECRSYRYFRNAVERHWDPAGIDLSGDRERIGELDAVTFDNLRRTIALFGAGEEAVTEDLAPLAVVLQGIEDQLYLTTQLYEEAKHADFFDRYWREVIRPAEEARGLERSSPTDERWFFSAYHELFGRNEAAMARLLESATPEDLARAYSHYHLTIEGILAQTGYYAVQTDYSGETPGLPALSGLVEAFALIRSDEGRHVGFGMAKLKALVGTEAVDVDLIHETVNDLLPLTQEVARTAAASDEGAGLNEGDLTAYAAERHLDRMAQLTDADADVSGVEEPIAPE